MIRPLSVITITMLIAFALYPGHDAIAQWRHLDIGSDGDGVPAYDMGGEPQSIVGYGSDVFIVVFSTFSFTSDTLYSSANDGMSWTATTNLPNIASIFVIDSNLYAATYDGIFISSDGGKTWDSISSGAMDSINMSMVVGNGSHLIATNGDSDAIFLSSNNGTSWRNVGENVPAVASLVADDSDILAGTAEGIYLSTDSGESWSLSNDTLMDINAFAASKSNIFAGRHSWAVPAYLPALPGGLFRSTDQGVTWEQYTNSLPSHYGPQIYALALHGNYVFAGLDGGMYAADINSDNWIDYSEGLPAASVNSIYVNDSTVFVGTDAHGFWERPLSEVTSVKGQGISDIPASFKLSQNYPNPFNPTTAIIYQVAQVSRVSLTVYDLLGQIVLERALGTEVAGDHLVNLNMSRFASGIYFYRVEAVTTDGKRYISAKRMELLK